nr:hypothetical protein [Actinoplanes derwentensis]GID90565.1 hypothetical protein Ade03nite_94890 [Actinoplanes derwentensis]
MQRRVEVGRWAVADQTQRGVRVGSAGDVSDVVTHFDQRRGGVVRAGEFQACAEYDEVVGEGDDDDAAVAGLESEQVGRDSDEVDVVADP